MGFDDIVNQAKNALGSEQVQDALKSEQAENISDKILDAGAAGASKLTGGSFDDQITGGRDAADRAVGTE